MQVRTYRATTMQEALARIRSELGPDAAILHTREVRTNRWFGLIAGSSEIEVTASANVNVPSRLGQLKSDPAGLDLESVPFTQARGLSAAATMPAGESRAKDVSLRVERGAGPALPEQVEGQLSDLQAMVKELCRRSHDNGRRELPEGSFRMFTDLIDSGLSEDSAQELVDRVCRQPRGNDSPDPVLMKARMARMVESEIRVTGPMAVTPGHCRLAALVGPTGVGKTTTIAKLAANFRLKEKRRVGLITVDTYRIAAVEQLRTYADIIDLPMQVVSTPREMRDAVRRMNDLDLVLLDTAGRSPKDEVKIQELKAFLSEAAADEVHLVLSSVAGERSLLQTAERFATVGTTALILTKLDEAPGLGQVLALLRASQLPLSYLTNGQNVPADIETADVQRVAQLILNAQSLP
jgi:flagellar biosynthesis protein FlhF